MKAAPWLIGETWTADITELNRYYGQKNDELQLPMDFLFTTVNKLSPAEFRKQDCGGKFGHGLADVRDQQSRHCPLL